MLDKYTVTLRDVSFTLYRDQIEFDAPNYFSDLFLGDFSESQTRTVELSRNPELFRIIVDYMSGYTVLPLTPDIIPKSMTLDMAGRNLLRDAEFFGLRGLLALLSSQTSRAVSPEIAVYGLGAVGPVLDYSTLLRGELPSGVTCDHRGVGSDSTGTWRQVLIKASGLRVTLLDTGDVLMSDPVLGSALQSSLAERGIPIPSKVVTTKGSTYGGLPCTVLRSAEVWVEGVKAPFVRRVRPTAQPRTEPDDLDRALEYILAGSNHRSALVLIAQSIVFTIKERSPSAKLPADSVREPVAVFVMAARLVSRGTAASCLL